jgi:hypothetical protein
MRSWPFERFVLDHGFEQPALVGEVDVKRALGDARRTRNLVHAGPIKAQIHEHLSRAVQNLPALRTIFLAKGMNRVWCGCNHWFIFSRKNSTPDMTGNVSRVMVCIAM